MIISQIRNKKFYLRTFVFHSLPLLGMAGSIGGFVIEPEEKKYQGIYEGTKVQIFGRNFYTWLSFDSRSPILQIILFWISGSCGHPGGEIFQIRPPGCENFQITRHSRVNPPLRYYSA